MNLDERATLVSLKISLPTGTRRDKQATEDVERIHNGRNLGRFNKDLISKTFLVRLKSIETQARAYLYAMTVAWSEEARLLAVKRYMEFSKQMQVFGNEFDAEAAVVIGNWDSIVHEAYTRLGALFDARQYPHASVLPSKFKFRLKFSPVPTAGDLRVQLSQELVDEMKARIIEDNKAAMEESARQVWERLYERVEHMAERLAVVDGRVHETTISHLARECDVLPELNFTDDPRLDKAIALVRKQLIVPIDRLRADPVLKKNTGDAARKIADAMAGWMKK